MKNSHDNVDDRHARSRRLATGRARRTHCRMVERAPCFGDDRARQSYAEACEETVAPFLPIRYRGSLCRGTNRWSTLCAATPLRCRQAIDRIGFIASVGGEVRSSSSPPSPLRRLERAPNGAPRTDQRDHADGRPLRRPASDGGSRQGQWRAPQVRGPSASLRQCRDRRSPPG